MKISEFKQVLLIAAFSLTLLIWLLTYKINNDEIKNEPDFIGFPSTFLVPLNK